MIDEQTKMEMNDWLLRVQNLQVTVFGEIPRVKPCYGVSLSKKDYENDLGFTSTPWFHTLYFF
jgi:hypothetical protein